jgi:prevent-host-death family protein
MTTVGMRDLRHRLREYLARVEAGEHFEVTVFGRPVARLEPVATAATIERLIEEGKVTAPLQRDTSRLPAPSPVTTGMTATEALLVERRSDER